MRILMLLALVASISACRGHQGDAGRSIVGPAGAQGPAGQDGLNGVDGSDGINGQDGGTGPQGPKGDVGPKGADGAIATVVNLCPGVSNYGTFVETALCINNQLYGVYSANGGFLTLLAPGSYTSNAIGSACNLTVLPNCQIQ